ncbi:MAG: protein phosphatase CheZ [Thermodesulfobacteriota bacterium]
MQNEIPDQLLEKITEKAEKTVREVITETLQKELTSALSQALIDSEFYRNLSTEMQSGLGDIYKEISAATSGDNGTLSSSEAQQLFSEASDQLDEILNSTEKATEEIMTIVEKYLDKTEESGRQLEDLKNGCGGPDALDKLIQGNRELNQDMLTLMTNLSFQDITGQRIKKIVDVLRKVETTIFDLYMTTGISIKDKYKNPDKDFQTIKNESSRKVSELKGPQKDINQSDVDDLLSQLGM